MTKRSEITALTYPIAVVMERVKLASPWMPYRWQARGVVRDILPEGSSASVIVRDEEQLQVVFPGLELKLVRDEAEGYYLNLTSPEPKLFVLWRLHDEEARPDYVTVSYNEGTRWADSGDNLDGVPLPPELLAWMGEFVEHNYRPQPRKKVRYASNKDGVIKNR
jgi:hypothetical protein